MQVGKKQINIREDNKSAVIERMLLGELTMPELEKSLLLSHTALIKIIKELQCQNVVSQVGIRQIDFGRPTKVFDINPDCSVAAAVAFSSRLLEILYFDMKGFEINHFKAEIDFTSSGQLLECIRENILKIRSHYRLENRLISTVCVSVPSYDLFDMDLSMWERAFREEIEPFFRGSEFIFKKDLEYIGIAEKNYGRLRSYADNALLLNFDNRLSASVCSLSGDYMGIRAETGNLNKILDDNFWNKVDSGKAPRDLIASYLAGELSVTAAVNRESDLIFGALKEIMTFLDIPLVVICCDAPLLGDCFLKHIRDTLGPRITAEYSGITDRSSACAGAVWLATYNSIKKIIQRNS